MDNKEKLAIDEVNKLIITKQYPIVDLNIFDYPTQLNPSEQIKGLIEYTLEIYNDLLNDINLLGDYLKNKYLLTLKNADLIDNQAIEKENTFLITLYSTIANKHAIDTLIDNYDKPLTKEELIQIHEQLLTGTSSEKKIGLRTNNLKFVGTWNNSERNIQYFPILEQNIDQALDKLIQLYNSNTNNTNIYNSILNPIIYHGLIATLQLFKDGNTRLARLIQHAELWKQTNKIVDTPIELPIIYASRQYYAYRDEYRNLIKNIAINPDEEAWNNWIKFNLKRIQDNIYTNTANIQTLKTRIKTK